MIGSEIRTVVVGLRVVEIEVEIDDRPRSIGLLVRVDGVTRWSSEEPGWRDIACGVDGSLFVWSARRLVIVPLEPDSDVCAIDCDEDIVTVFKVDERWLLVCESSLRLVSGGALDLSRIEMPDVVTDERWDQGQFLIRCADGSRFKIVVFGDSLEITPAD